MSQDGRKPLLRSESLLLRFDPRKRGKNVCFSIVVEALESSFFAPSSGPSRLADGPTSWGSCHHNIPRGKLVQPRTAFSSFWVVAKTGKTASGQNPTELMWPDLTPFQNFPTMPLPLSESP